MLDLNTAQMIEDLMVYADSNQVNLFYIIPDQPRFRIDDVTKKPVFSFIKYKAPIDNKDGSKGGGFLIFDSTLTVPPDKGKKIEDALNAQLQARNLKGGDGQPLKAEIGRIMATSGTASLVLLDSGGALVSKIESVGKPSLFGSMICSFTAELSPEGVTVLEAVMSKSGGVAQIAYDLHVPATMPPITGHVWFYASKFYGFYQSISKTTNDGGWGGSDTTSETDDMREAFVNSQCGGVQFDFTSLAYVDPTVGQKIHDSITNWGWSQIDTAVKTAILPDIKATEDRGDHGVDSITKYQSTWESSSFNRYINEREAVTFEIVPQGTLPNISDMGFAWKDFVTDVDANDPFFAQIRSSVNVNADFDRFAINSVDVHCEYAKGSPATIQDFHFTKPDDVGKFASDTVNGDMHYAYSFAVNYKDQSKAYQTDLIPTDKAQITVNANDLGILYVHVSVGSVDFGKTPQVQVAVRYPESDANDQPVSTQFNFAADKKQDTFLAVLLKPVDKPYEYQFTYILADGSQITTDWQQGTSSELFVNSPFVMHSYSFLAEGDFANNIDGIFLKMQYADAANHVAQDTDFTFSQANQSKDWVIPVVAGGKGTITYSGVITYKNHTQEEIPPTTTDRDLIEFGPPNQLLISVAPDATLIDFSKVKLVKVDVEYKDDAHALDLTHEFVLKDASTQQKPWTFYARDPAKTSYSYTATYYLSTTPPKVVQAPPATSSDSDLVLTMPS